jgi:hypothetical protein
MMMMMMMMTPNIFTVTSNKVSVSGRTPLYTEPLAKLCLIVKVRA